LLGHLDGALVLITIKLGRLLLELRVKSTKSIIDAWMMGPESDLQTWKKLMKKRFILGVQYAVCQRTSIAYGIMVLI
jgi:hypothetical protein